MRARHWLTIVWGPATYFVSDDGRVLYQDKESGPARVTTTLGPFVQLGTRWVHVAELVLWTHFGEPLPGEHPIHRDRNLLNNDIRNLRWSFPEEALELDNRQVVAAAIARELRVDEWSLQ